MRFFFSYKFPTFFPARSTTLFIYKGINMLIVIVFVRCKHNIKHL